MSCIAQYSVAIGILLDLAIAFEELCDFLLSIALAKTCLDLRLQLYWVIEIFDTGRIRESRKLCSPSGSTIVSFFSDSGLLFSFGCYSIEKENDQKCIPFTMQTKELR